MLGLCDRLMVLVVFMCVSLFTVSDLPGGEKASLERLGNSLWVEIWFHV